MRYPAGQCLPMRSLRLCRQVQTAERYVIGEEARSADGRFAEPCVEQHDPFAAMAVMAVLEVVSRLVVVRE